MLKYFYYLFAMILIFKPTYIQTLDSRDDICKFLKPKVKLITEVYKDFDPKNEIFLKTNGFRKLVYNLVSKINIPDILKRFPGMKTQINMLNFQFDPYTLMYNDREYPKDFDYFDKQMKDVLSLIDKKNLEIENLEKTASTKKSNLVEFVKTISSENITLLNLRLKSIDLKSRIMRFREGSSVTILFLKELKEINKDSLTQLDKEFWNYHMKFIKKMYDENSMIEDFEKMTEFPEEIKQKEKFSHLFNSEEFLMLKINELSNIKKTNINEIKRITDELFNKFSYLFDLSLFENYTTYNDMFKDLKKTSMEVLKNKNELKELEKNYKKLQDLTELKDFQNMRFNPEVLSIAKDIVGFHSKLLSIGNNFEDIENNGIKNTIQEIYQYFEPEKIDDHYEPMIELPDDNEENQSSMEKSKNAYYSLTQHYTTKMNEIEHFMELDKYAEEVFAFTMSYIQTTANGQTACFHENKINVFFYYMSLTNVIAYKEIFFKKYLDFLNGKDYKGQAMNFLQVYDPLKKLTSEEYENKTLNEDGNLVKNDYEEYKTEQENSQSLKNIMKLKDELMNTKTKETEDEKQEKEKFKESIAAQQNSKNLSFYIANKMDMEMEEEENKFFPERFKKPKPVSWCSKITNASVKVVGYASSFLLSHGQKILIPIVVGLIFSYIITMILSGIGIPILAVTIPGILVTFGMGNLIKYALGYLINLLISAAVKFSPLLAKQVYSLFSYLYSFLETDRDQFSYDLEEEITRMERSILFKLSQEDESKKKSKKINYKKYFESRLDLEVFDDDMDLRKKRMLVL